VTGKGTTGATGPAGPTGSGGAGAGCFGTSLPKGQSETGTWSATIHAEVGDFEVQSQGSITFNCQLSEAQGRSLKVHYLNEKDVALPGSVVGCPGSAEQPEAEEGNLCIFQGATATAGSLETEWKNVECPTSTGAKCSAATPTFIEDPGGNHVAGVTDFAVGALVIYRTLEYKENLPETKTTLATILNADGSFAVTAKE